MHCSECGGKLIIDLWCFMCAKSYCKLCADKNMKSLCVSCPNGFCGKCDVPKHMKMFTHEKRLVCHRCRQMFHPMCGFKKMGKNTCGKCVNITSKSLPEVPALAPLPKATKSAPSLRSAPPLRSSRPPWKL